MRERAALVITPVALALGTLPTVAGESSPTEADVRAVFARADGSKPVRGHHELGIPIAPAPAMGRHGVETERIGPATGAIVASAVVFDKVSFAFDEHVVLDDVSFSIPKGSMRILLGASGAGKSVLLKLILGLLRPDSGAIFVNGQRIDVMGERDLMRMRADVGMLFQDNALFDSLTVAENVGYRLFEETDMPKAHARGRVQEVLGFVGLEEYIDRLPSELSGGQRRRVAIARAMAAKPSLLLFDDPTSGLDPIIATTVDNEIVKLRDLEHSTSIVVTHQIRDAFYVATHAAVRENGVLRIIPMPEASASQTRFMVLNGARICFEGTGTELLASRDRYLQGFLYRTLPPW